MLLPGSDPKGKNKPLTSGHHVFGLCRHPQYAGLLALCLSICLISQSADRLFYTLILMIVLDKKADLEEHDMVKSHPEYARYLLQVPKFIPSLTALGLRYAVFGQQRTTRMRAPAACARRQERLQLQRHRAAATRSADEWLAQLAARLAAQGETDGRAQRAVCHPRMTTTCCSML